MLSPLPPKKKIGEQRFSDLFREYKNGTLGRNELKYIDLLKLFRSLLIFESFELIKKQPPRGVPRKRYSENMQQSYRRTPMPKYDFNKVANQLY